MMLDQLEQRLNALKTLLQNTPYTFEKDRNVLKGRIAELEHIIYMFNMEGLTWTDNN